MQFIHPQKQVAEGMTKDVEVLDSGPEKSRPELSRLSPEPDPDPPSNFNGDRMDNVFVIYGRTGPRIAKGVGWSIGSGELTRSWTDQWVPGLGALIDIATNRVPDDRMDTLVCESAVRGRGWNWKLFSVFLPHSAVLCIAAAPLPQIDRGPDRVYNFFLHDSFAEERPIWEIICPGYTVALGDLVSAQYATLLKLDTGWMKLNTDGASKGNPGRSGAGGLLRDSDGRWVHGYVRNVGITTSFSAELWAVRTGLEMAWDLGFRRIILEVDSETVVRLVLSSNDQACSNGALLRDIRSLLQQDWLVVVVEHTLHEGNFCVD
ncbi:hypothetical protein CRG98_035458 [Punica granatum]|uniref:RNase H type-1 domain-containing protein n=1 Tax=Punica granatum TaxID=22663 RepID=A0A2I0IJI8_PUNGR|nr:hypothetical protein CRG98_035458 [Punica granatum]